MVQILKKFSVAVLYLLLIPWSLLGQSDQALQYSFGEAVQHFQMNEFDEALHTLDQINTICERQGFLEQCIQSKIIRANISRNRREFENAKIIIQEALEKAQIHLSEGHSLAVHAHVELAYLEADQASYNLAKEWAFKAVEIVNGFELHGIPRARAYLVLGYVEGGLGNYNSGIENYLIVFEFVKELERTLEIRKILTQAHNNIGVAYRRLGQLEKARNHYESNLTLVEETFGSNHLEMGYAYNSIGTVYFMTGDFGTAADYFQQAADIFRENLGENSSAYAAALNNTGSVYYTMNDFKNATEIYEKAQRIKEKTLGRNHPDTAVGYANLAAIYEQNKDYNAALKNQKLSITVRKNIHGPDHPSLVAAYLSLGKFYITTENFELARKQFFEAERIIRLRLGENHPDSWEVNNQIALSYHEEKQYDKAISYYQKTLHLMSDKGISTKENYDFNSISYPYSFLDSISGIGDSSLQQYKETGKTSVLEDAYYFLMWSADIIEKLQTEYQSEASKLNLIDQNYPVYTHAIETCSYLYKETSEEKWLEEIFRFNEMSRSRIALELLQESQAKNFAGVPENILEKERQINTDIAEYYQQLHVEQEKGFDADERIESAYRDSLFNSRQNLNNFTEQLEINYPEYYRLKYDQSFVNRPDVSELLSPEETLVNYIVSKEQVYALLLDTEDISFHSLGSPDSLSTQIQSFREAVATDNRTEYSELAYHLYQKLLEPLLPSVKSNSLIIAPDQMLHYLPFEMLLTKKSEGADYYKMPYLIREMKISYVPSATVLQMLNEQKISEPRNLFAVAPFNGTAVQADEQNGTSEYLADLSPLPLTRYETREIAGIFQERRSFWDYLSPEKADVLLGQDATKTNIENTSFEEYGFIHFATHAFVNEEDPALSGIAFWGDNDDDGIIYVNDIYNMTMKADLVVLGACETGLGAVYKGEGIIGFTRAFFYAGASNLLVSLWKVNDQPTANLMIQFYRYVKEGHSYSASLQMAKLDLMNQPDFAAPRHWAAFVLQGR